MTDAAHMLSDLAGFLISLFAIWVGSRPPSSKMSFGWHRAGQLSKELKRLYVTACVYGRVQLTGQAGSWLVCLLSNLIFSSHVCLCTNQCRYRKSWFTCIGRGTFKGH